MLLQCRNREFQANTQHERQQIRNDQSAHHIGHNGKVIDIQRLPQTAQKQPENCGMHEICAVGHATQWTEHRMTHGLTDDP